MAFFTIDNHELSYLAIGDIYHQEPLIFLPGIMGNKKNLAGFVEKLLKLCPDYSAIIFDLRNHGESSKHWQPFTVEACAQDIADATYGFKPKKIFGHSFGGKVALCAGALMESIEQIWMLDCPIGPISEVRPLNRPQSFTAFEVKDALLKISWPVSSRKDLVDQLVTLGVNNALAAWMTTNLVAREDGLYLTFDPLETRAMLNDFVLLDAWPVLRQVSRRAAVHLVAAEYGQRVMGDADKFKEIVGHHNFFHVLEKSGHFLHVDNPSGLIEIIKKYLVL